jgi:uncharacterized protein (DUF1697 family)
MAERTAYAALLRGINVGGRRKLAMAALREICVAAGCDEVATYIQSGNVVLTSELGPADLVAALEGGIEGATGLDVAVVVRTAAELAAIVEANPYPGEGDPTKLVVAFLSGELPAGALDALDPDAFSPEELSARGSDVYLHLPDGQAHSKLAEAFGKAAKGTTATVRNWRTVLKLRDMASTLGA